MAGEDSMLFWLSRACSDAREIAERKQVHIAAELGVDQSSIARFERATAWPRNPDAIVAAYAKDLDVAASDLWREAMRLWSAHEAEQDVVGVTVEDLTQHFEGRASNGAGVARRSTGTAVRSDARRASRRVPARGTRSA